MSEEAQEYIFFFKGRKKNWKFFGEKSIMIGCLVVCVYYACGKCE